MPVLSGPGNLSPTHFTVANDGLVSLTNPPLPAAGGTVTGPVVIKTNTAPSLPATPPVTLLHIAAAEDTTPVVLVDGFANSSPGLYFRHGNGTATLPTAINAGQQLGSIVGQGYSPSGYASMVAITYAAAQNWTDIAKGTSIYFRTTANDTVALTERMRIDASGNVGIGTSSPSNKLDVVGAIRSTAPGNPTTGAGIELNYSPATGPGTAFVLSYDRTAAAYRDLSINSAALSIWARGTATFSGDTGMLFNVGAERMRIDASGNVGIGIVPGAKLEVGGTIASNTTNPTLTLYQPTTTASSNRVYSFKNGTARWEFALGGADAEGAGDTGSSCSFATFGNTGAYLGNALTILRGGPGGSKGNVGIGFNATLPKYALSVIGTDTNAQMQIACATGENHTLLFGNNPAITNFDYCSFIKSTTNTAANYGTMLSFWTHGVVSAPTGAVERLRIDSSGLLYVAQTLGGSRINVMGTAASAPGGSGIGINAGPAGNDTTTQLIGFTDGGITTFMGAITRNGVNTVNYATSSDARLKEDVEPSERGLDDLMKLRVSDFRFVGDDQLQYGLVAQEVAEVYPEAVFRGGDDPALEPWMLDYGRFTPLIIRAMQQQQARIETLENTVAKGSG